MDKEKILELCSILADYVTDFECKLVAYSEGDAKFVTVITAGDIRFEIHNKRRFVLTNEKAGFSMDTRSWTAAKTRFQQEVINNLTLHPKTIMRKGK